MRLLVLCVVWMGSWATAKTTLEIEPGFDGRFRAGRWSPVFVKVKSDQPRSGVLELRVPNASASVVTIQQVIGIGTDSQRYVLYAPLSLMHDPLRAELRDADTDALLAVWPPPGDDNLDRGGEQIGFVIVTAGSGPALQSYRRDSARGATLVSNQRLANLPVSPMGYDAVDVLFLNHPDWNALSIDQQRAIADWTRAGGVLLIYPGVDPIPDNSPLAPLLPCDLGQPVVQKLSDAQLKADGLPARYREIGARTLLARPGAREVKLIERLNALTRPVGLGQIVMLPIDAGAMQFTDSERYQTLWTSFFNSLIGTEPKPEPNSGFYDSDLRAAHAALDYIGDIPDTGAFGFSYIAIIIGALMFIVGPIDFFVLKKIGHQPWTWATTLGWIGLFTTGALYAGHLMRSGDLHFRTLRLVEQVENQVVAMDDVALIYAPRSATYSITGAPDAWWQPVPAGDRYSRDTLATPVVSHQDYRGNLPGPMWIDIWNWRFLHASRVVDQPGVIDISLARSGDTLTGTITNRSDRPINTIQFQTSDGWATMEQLPGHERERHEQPNDAIAPGETRPFSVKVNLKDVTIRGAANFIDRTEPIYGRSDSSYDYVFGVSPSRRIAVERLMRAGAVLVYAKVDDTATDVQIEQPNAITQHRTMFQIVVTPKS